MQYTLVDTHNHTHTNLRFHSHTNIYSWIPLHQSITFWCFFVITETRTQILDALCGGCHIAHFPLLLSFLPALPVILKALYSRSATPLSLALSPPIFMCTLKYCLVLFTLFTIYMLRVHLDAATILLYTAQWQIKGCSFWFWSRSLPLPLRSLSRAPALTLPLSCSLPFRMKTETLEERDIISSGPY